MKHACLFFWHLMSEDRLATKLRIISCPPPLYGCNLGAARFERLQNDTKLWMLKLTMMAFLDLTCEQKSKLWTLEELPPEKDERQNVVQVVD